MRAFPKPRCRFGRQHSWSAFVYIPERYCCSVCGIEQDDAWWDGEGNYVGPDEAVYADINNGGWLLREGASDESANEHLSPA